jgi:hypothetical protein
MFAGWANRHQLEVIDYLQDKNRVLKERLGGLDRYRAQIHKHRPTLKERGLYNLANVETYDDLKGSYEDDPEKPADQLMTHWDMEGR